MMVPVSMHTGQHLLLSNHFFFFFFLAWAFSSCGKWGLFFAVVHGLGSHDFSCHDAQAPGVWASVVSGHRLSSCGLWT